MIRILATVLLAVCLTASGAFATSWDDLIPVGGLWHKKFTDVPFTGKVDEGLELGAIKNGKLEGPWVLYWYNGGLASKGAWKNGKQEGAWVTYHENSRVAFKGAFKNGKKEGPWVVYREDGTKDDRSGTYRNGVRVSD